MSSRYPGRRRPNRSDDDEDDDQGSNWRSNDIFGSSFDFRFGFQDIDQMIDSMFKSLGSINQKLSPDSNSNAVYYGYQVNIGPDGKPHVKEFGNVKPTSRGTFEKAPAREPFVDTVVDEKENVLKVVVEMPGVQKEDIKLQANEDSLNIRAGNGERSYDTTVPLSVSVDPNSAKATYRNGVLEVKLKLKEPPKPKGTNIVVE